MARTKGGTVKEAGAIARDVLIGMEEMNRNLLIRIHEDQGADGKRITGTFDLLHKGNGTYSQYIEDLLRDEPYTADELIELIRARDENCTHILNKNSLLRVWLPLPEESAEWLFAR